ncbi:hypothetical protein GOP47_0006797, partial [Adiantum capillus-veneris]
RRRGRTWRGGAAYSIISLCRARVYYHCFAAAATMESLSVIANCFLIITLTAATSANDEAQALETYIVHARAKRMPSLFVSHQSWHASFVSSAIHNTASSSSSSASAAEERMLYSYSSTLQGFAARFTPQEAARLQTASGWRGNPP